MKQTKREKIDELLKDAAKQSLDDMINEYPSLEELEGKYEFSQKHGKRMERLFKKAKKAEEHGNTDAWHRFRRISFNAAAVLCMAFTIFTLVAFTVPEIRVSIVNYIVEQKDDHAVINTGSNIYEGELIEGAPKYIPNNFVIEEYNVTDITTSITYLDENGNFVYYTRYKGDVSINADNSGELESIEINKHRGYIFGRNNEMTVVFHDGEHTYQIFGNVGRKEIIKISESIIE